MNRIRYTLSFLLLAGVACVHAQQPIVKINSDTLECDVQAAAGAPIFQLDATGNVLVKGTMSGPGCGTQTGGGGGATFGFNGPPASGVVINFGATTVAAGSVATVPLTYQAYNATGGCSVGTPTTTGTCPAVTASGGTCVAGAQGSCAPTAATLSIPTVAQMATNTSCAYTATATCMPGGVVSSAVLTVTTTGGSGGGDPSCSLATMHSSSGAAWNRLTSPTPVKYGDGTVATKDSTDYVSVWSYPGSSTPWPGSQGGQTRPNVNSLFYLSEKFVVPSDTSLVPKWSWTGSGVGSNFSLAISKCPGDFGQTGTQLTTGCKLAQGHSSNGMSAYVNATQQGIACTLVPGQTYYLNILPNANLPVSNVTSPSSPVCQTCTPWIVRN